MVCLIFCVFGSLVSGARGFGPDGVNYAFKGTKIHRVVKNSLISGVSLIIIVLTLVVN